MQQQINTTTKIMSNKKQTSVEWLIDEILKHEMTFFGTASIPLRIIKQAKEMHKEEIVSTWHNGYDNQSPMLDEDNCGEQYYKETYEQ